MRKIEFYKNKYINEVLRNYYETFLCTLDTADYVPEKYNKKICKYIFKNLKLKLKEVDKVYKKVINDRKKKIKEKNYD